MTPTACLRSVLASLLPLVLLCAAPDSAHASIFANSARWPIGADGLASIDVCVETDSAVNERADGAAGGLIHDRNPSLDEVVAHVRAALHASWESVSAVRFGDWRSCGALSPSELATHVRVYLNPNASNEAIIGTAARGAQHGVSIMPWGNTFNRCIKYNWARARVGYSFDCVEQYTIHEFGHTLGFLHEDTHPLSSDACLQQFSDSARVAAADYSADYTPGRAYTIVNPGAFDRRSIMTYSDACADVNGVRFGNPTLSDADALAAWAIYPPPLTSADDALAAGQGLHRGDQLRSKSGRYRLILQSDGNLVLYDAGGSARWSTGTWGRNVDYAILQVDGNLVLYDQATAVWASGTNGKRHERLVVQDDGNLVLYQLGAVWATATDTATSGYLVGERGSALAAGETLSPGAQLDAGDGHFRAAMQTDGNLVVYDDGGAALWSSKTNGVSVSGANLSASGNLSVVRTDGSSAFTSNTSAQHARLIMQADGNLVLYAGTAVWSTNTQQ